jgi:hypothetical protein
LRDSGTKLRDSGIEGLENLVDRVLKDKIGKIPSIPEFLNPQFLNYSYFNSLIPQFLNISISYQQQMLLLKTSKFH